MTSDRCLDPPMASGELPAGKKHHLPCFPSEDDQDLDFWDAIWDHAHRFAEENERDERFRERQERIENYERTSITTD